MLASSRALIARVQLGDAPAALSQALSTLSSVIYASTSYGRSECSCSSSSGREVQPSATPASPATAQTSRVAPFLALQRPSAAFSRLGLSTWAPHASVSGWHGARQLHAGSAAQQAADVPGGSASGSGGKESEGAAKPQEQTVTNPLAAALASAASGPVASGSASAAGGLAQAAQAAAGRGRRQPRNWMWWVRAHTHTHTHTHTHRVQGGGGCGSVGPGEGTGGTGMADARLVRGDGRCGDGTRRCGPARGSDGTVEFHALSA